MNTRDPGRTLTIRIKRSPSGMYFATSEDEPMFFLAQRSRKALMAALPVAMEETIRENRHKDVSASPAKTVTASDATLRVFPREKLAELA